MSMAAEDRVRSRSSPSRITNTRHSRSVSTVLSASKDGSTNTGRANSRPSPGNLRLSPHDTLWTRCSATFARAFQGPLPEDLEHDGIPERPLYSFSAVAMVATYRFFAGLPMHRQDRLQRALGVEVPDASIWDMCERLADVMRPINRALHALAKDAVLFFGDDTG